MISFFARHPTAANLLMIVIAVMGLLSLPALRRETFPDFASTKVQITVAYPGASALDVEEAVSQRIEDALEGVTSSVEVVSQSREGVAVVTAEMEPNGDMTTFLADVTSKVDSIANFPDGAEDPIIERLGDTQAVISLAITGPMEVTDLEAYCELVKRELKAIPGISLVDIEGFSERQFKISLSNAAAMQYELSVDMLADTIANQSVDMPAGTLEAHDGEILIRYADQRRTVEEFEDLIVVSGTTGGEVRLGDVAKVTEQFDKAEEKILFNGKRAGLLKIKKTKSQDSLDMLDSIKEYLARKQQTKPPSVEMTLTEDLTSLVEDRLQLLVTNGYQGLILVFLALWLFLDLRLAFWVAMGLPVSFLGAFFVMEQIGYSLNMMTMLALLLALGLLMDDGIVLAENISAHLARGKKAMDAAIDGVSEVSVGVLSSFATTICVFLPMAFLEGDIGKVLLVLPVVLIVVMAVSLIEAFLILPSHMGHSLKGFDLNNRSVFRKRFESWFARLRENWLGRLVDFAVDWRYVTMGAVICVFLWCIGMMTSGVLKFQAFPDIDGDVVQARVLLPPGTPLAKTEDVVARLTDALDEVNAELTPQQPDGEQLVRAVTVRYNFNQDANESGPHLATVSADLLSAEERNGSIDDLVERWREKSGILSDVTGLTFTEPALGPAGRAIEIRLQGHDLERIDLAAQDIVGWLGRFEGVSDLDDDLRLGKREVQIRLRPGAASTNVRGGSVATQLSAAFQGRTIAEIQVGTEGYDIDVALSAADAANLEDLEFFNVEIGGEKVPLQTIATLKMTRGYSRIARIDGLRTVTVTGDVNTSVANTSEILNLFSAEFLPELQERFPDVAVALEGEQANSGETMTSMGRGLLLGLLGVFVLLSFQFRSYIEPIVVMVAIPFALIGVMIGHVIMGLPMTMPSMLGFVSLAGVVVNDSILLVEFVKATMRKGADVRAATKQASRLRFRAVLLTSLTTVAGLLPLLSERSLQAQILIPLAVSIVFGMLASTVLVLIVIPSLYAILGEFGLLESDGGH